MRNQESLYLRRDSDLCYLLHRSGFAEAVDALGKLSEDPSLVANLIYIVRLRPKSQLEFKLSTVKNTLECNG